MNFNRVLKVVLPEQLVEKIGGYKEYYTQFNKLKNPWGAHFNNQKIRTQIFDKIVDTVKVDLIVETGTFRGTTTNYMSQKVICPIYSVELSMRYYTFSKLRFKDKSNIKIYNNDSRAFLRYLSSIEEWKNKVIFFYLDAHWNADLPLDEELNIIFSTWKNVIIMIDDFKVENDEGYKYDQYQDVSLDISYLRSVYKYNLNYYFPINSSEETGAKRGSIVITNNNQIAENLNKNEYLMKYSLI